MTRAKSTKPTDAELLRRVRALAKDWRREVGSFDPGSWGAESRSRVFDGVLRNVLYDLQSEGVIGPRGGKP